MHPSGRGGETNRRVCGENSRMGAQPHPPQGRPRAARRSVLSDCRILAGGTTPPLRWCFRLAQSNLLRRPAQPPSDEGGGPPNGRVGRRDTARIDTRMKLLQERKAKRFGFCKRGLPLSLGFAEPAPLTRGAKEGLSIKSSFLQPLPRRLLLPPSDEGGGSAQR